MFTLKDAPQPAQIPFFESTARHICYGGARGGGKSWAMRRKFVLLALNYAGLRLLLLRRTLAELEGNHIFPLLNDLNGIAKYVESKKMFKFPNGSFIKLGYCDAEKDVYQFQGQEYDVIGLEEATHFTETQRTFIMTCNRGVRDDFTPRMYYTCNPGGVGHDWVKRLFIDRDFNDNEDPSDYVFFQAKVTDNAVLMDKDPGYIKQLQALPEDLRRAHLDGDWDVIEGQYFKEFRRDKHVCNPFEIPAHWKRYRSMDWGYNDPCAVLWGAMSPDGHMYIYRERYQNQTLASEMARLIKEDSGLEKICYTVASPDMWQKRGTIIKTAGGFAGECVADAFIKGGIPVIAADNSRVVGWNRVREWLRDAPDGTPYLQIFDNCTNLIKYMPMMQYDPHNKEDVADGLPDHAPESLRYMLMSRPSPTKLEKPKKNNILPYDPFTRSKPVASGFLAL